MALYDLAVLQLRGSNVEAPFQAIAEKCHAMYEEKLELMKSATP